MKDFIAKCRIEKKRILIVATGSGRAARLQELLRDGVREPELVESFAAFVNGTEPLSIAVGPLSGGFVLEESGLVVVTESELYNTKAVIRRRGHSRTTNVEAIIRDVSELREGDPVVHAAHGVGRKTCPVQRVQQGGGTGFQDDVHSSASSYCRVMLLPS